MSLLDRVSGIYEDVCSLPQSDALPAIRRELQAVAGDVMAGVAEGKVTNTDLQAIMNIVGHIKALAQAVISTETCVQAGRADLHLRIAGVLSGVDTVSGSGPDEDVCNYDPWRQWFSNHISHPYYDSKQRDSLLAMVPNMTPQKMQTWFVNVRRRSGWSELYKKHASNKREVMEAIFRACEEEEQLGVQSAQVHGDARRLVGRVREYLTLESKKTQLQPWLVDLVDRYKERMTSKQATEQAGLTVDTSSSSSHMSRSGSSPLTPLDSPSPSLHSAASPGYSPPHPAANPSLAARSALATKDGNQASSTNGTSSSSSTKRKAVEPTAAAVSHKKQKPSLYTNKHTVPSRRHSTSTTTSTAPPTARRPPPPPSPSPARTSPSCFGGEGPSVSATVSQRRTKEESISPSSSTPEEQHYQQGVSHLEGNAGITSHRQQSYLEPCAFFYESPASSVSPGAHAGGETPCSYSLTAGSYAPADAATSIVDLGFENQPLALAHFQVPIVQQNAQQTSSSSSSSFFSCDPLSSPCLQVDNAGFVYTSTGIDASDGHSVLRVYQQQQGQPPPLQAYAQAWSAPTLAYGQLAYVNHHQYQPVLETAASGAMTGLGIQMPHGLWSQASPSTHLNGWATPGHASSSSFSSTSSSSFSSPASFAPFYGTPSTSTNASLTPASSYVYTPQVEFDVQGIVTGNDIGYVNTTTTAAAAAAACTPSSRKRKSLDEDEAQTPYVQAHSVKRSRSQASEPSISEYIVDFSLANGVTHGVAPDYYGPSVGDQIITVRENASS